MVLFFSFFTDLGNEELESFQRFANILCYTQTHRMNNRKEHTEELTDRLDWTGWSSN